jgi:NADH dehydrogenase FAD-containing subunit
MKIVILGGGFGGVYTLKYLHKLFSNADSADFTQTMRKKI